MFYLFFTVHRIDPVAVKIIELYHHQNPILKTIYSQKDKNYYAYREVKKGEWILW